MQVRAGPRTPPIVILPGFGNRTEDYTCPFGDKDAALTTALDRRGFKAFVPPVRQPWRNIVWFNRRACTSLALGAHRLYHQLVYITSLSCCAWSACITETQALCMLHRADLLVWQCHRFAGVAQGLAQDCAGRLVSGVLARTAHHAPWLQLVRILDPALRHRQLDNKQHAMLMQFRVACKSMHQCSSLTGM